MTIPAAHALSFGNAFNIPYKHGSNHVIVTSEEKIYLSDTTAGVTVRVSLGRIYPVSERWEVDMSSVNPVIKTKDETSETYLKTITDEDIAMFLSDADYVFSIKPNAKIKLCRLGAVRQGELRVLGPEEL